MIVMRNRGFTLVEMIIYILLSGIVMTSVYQLLIGQSRGYGKQREVMDVHGSLRAASALLSWEIRQASAADGDIYAIDTTSITLRSAQGSGIICARHVTLPRFGVLGEPADMAATTDDSALVFAGNDAWNVLNITNLSTVGALGVGNCAWPGAGAPDVEVEIAVTVPSDTASLAVGFPFRAFRRVEYGIYEDAGRWWLGRKVGGAASYEKLTGPLLPRVSGGLVFTYADSTGAVTTDPTKVSSVDFIIRAESYRIPDAKSGYQVDTLATRVAVRG